MTIQDKLAKVKLQADKIVVLMKRYEKVDNERRLLVLQKAAEIYDLVEELQGDSANRTP